MSIPNESYTERDRNPINRWLNRRMDTITEKVTHKFVDRYAKRNDGTMDEDLANRIRYEITRRSEMGRELDVFEPGRWAIYSSILGALSGGAAKLLHDKTIANKEVNQPAVKSALIGTAFGSFAAALLIGGRILSFARYKSGLYAGAQIAITQHNLQQKMLGTKEEVALAKEAAPTQDEKTGETWKGKVSDSHKPSPSIAR